MVLLPWHRVAFASPLPPSEVKARLELRTQPPGHHGARAAKGKFLEGTVDSGARRFRLRPLGRRWSSIVARGDVQADGGGSRVRLLVLPSLAGALFMAVMLGGVLAAVFAATVTAHRKGPVPPNVLMVWILPLVAWVLLTNSMRRDGARMANVLYELLDGRRAAPGPAGQGG